MKCKYQPAWTSCEAETLFGLDFCARHHKESIESPCWCGDPSVTQCSVASSFVCGAPLCAKHECRSVSYGMTGSYGNPHSEKGQKQYEAWKAARAQEADRG